LNEVGPRRLGPGRSREPSHRTALGRPARSALV